MEDAVRTGVGPSATIFPLSQHAARQTGIVAGIVILPRPHQKQVDLQRAQFQLLHLRLHLSRLLPALATTAPMESAVPSLEELSVIPTRSTGAVRSTDFVEEPRSTATATLVSTIVPSI